MAGSGEDEGAEEEGGRFGHESIQATFCRMN